jgi:hypothetical protein
LAANGAVSVSCVRKPRREDDARDLVADVGRGLPRFSVLERAPLGGPFSGSSVTFTFEAEGVTVMETSLFLELPDERYVLSVRGNAEFADDIARLAAQLQDSLELSSED